QAFNSSNASRTTPTATPNSSAKWRCSSLLPGGSRPSQMRSRSSSKTAKRPLPKEACLRMVTMLAADFRRCKNIFEHFRIYLLGKGNLAHLDGADEPWTALLPAGGDGLPGLARGLGQLLVGLVGRESAQRGQALLGADGAEDLAGFEGHGGILLLEIADHNLL